MMQMNNSEVDKLVRGVEVQQALMDGGQKLALEASQLAVSLGLIEAPSKGGAASIHPELVITQGVPEVRVSWDRKHFYMAFAEVGTEHERARSFLRAAASRY